MTIKTIIICDDCGKEIHYEGEIHSNIHYCLNCSMKDKNNLNLMN